MVCTQVVTRAGNVNFGGAFMFSTCCFSRPSGNTTVPCCLLLSFAVLWGADLLFCSSGCVLHSWGCSTCRRHEVAVCLPKEEAVEKGGAPLRRLITKIGRAARVAAVR